MVVFTEVTTMWYGMVMVTEVTTMWQGMVVFTEVVSSDHIVTLYGGV